MTTWKQKAEAMRAAAKRRLTGFDYRHSKEWKTADTWYKEFVPVEDANYEFLYDFSRSRFDYISAVLNQVDEKADSLFRFAAVLAGGLATGLKLFEAKAGIVVASLPALICFGLSIATALVAKKPTFTGAMMEISDAMQLPLNETRAVVAAQLHSACVATAMAIERKTKWIEASTWSTVVGLLSLALFAVV